jgi:hypothetical protein
MWFVTTSVISVIGTIKITNNLTVRDIPTFSKCRRWSRQALLTVVSTRIRKALFAPGNYALAYDYSFHARITTIFMMAYNHVYHVSDKAAAQPT